MSRYIDHILQPGEKVLYSTNAHWMFYLPAVLGVGTFPAATANNCSKELRRSCFRWETT